MRSRDGDVVNASVAMKHVAARRVVADDIVVQDFDLEMK